MVEQFNRIIIRAINQNRPTCMGAVGTLCYLIHIFACYSPGINVGDNILYIGDNGYFPFAALVVIIISMMMGMVFNVLEMVVKEN